MGYDITRELYIRQAQSPNGGAPQFCAARRWVASNGYHSRKIRFPHGKSVDKDEKMVLYVYVK